MKAPSIERVIFGLLFIALGVVFLGEHLDFWHVDWHFFKWYYILAGIGVYLLIFKNQWGSAAILLGIALVFALGDYGYSINYMIRTFWPVILIIIGINLLFLRSRRNRGNLVRNDELDINAILAGLKQEVESDDFKGGEINVVMGGVELNLEKSVIATSPAVIDVSCVMGGVKLRIPKDWKVTLKATPVLGGVEDKRGAVTESEKVLIIKGSLVMSGLEIY